MLLLLSLLALASPDRPEEVPEVDVSAFRDELVVLGDGEGHYVAFRESAPREAVWFGDGEHFFAQQIVGSGASGDTRWNVTARDFRVRRGVSVTFTEGAYAMGCAGAERALTPLPEAKARAIAREATFHEHRWRRNLVGAWRDEWGVYYVVDRATGDDPDADHRVYIGWRGQILRAPLRLLASDSLGRVWAAGNGTRRLVVTQGEARYVEGDQIRALYALNLYQDGPLVYTTFGIYGDAPHGTPCDIDALREPPPEP